MHKEIATSLSLSSIPEVGKGGKEGLGDIGKCKVIGAEQKQDGAWTRQQTPSFFPPAK